MDIDKGNEYDINYEGNNSDCLLIKKTYMYIIWLNILFWIEK